MPVPSRIAGGAGVVDGPAAPAKRSEFARAWTVLLAGTVGVGLGTTGLPFYSYGLFVRPLGQEFGWSRGGISLGITCLMIGTIVTSPVVGRAVDRFGVRAVGMLSQVGLAIGFLLVSFVGPNIATFYAAFLALSFLGSGTSPIVWTRAVAGWFNESRGLALGIMLCGTGLVALSAPTLVTAAIADLGWRWAYRILAATPVVIALPLTYLFLHSGRATANKAVSSAGLTLREALRTSAFWRIECAFALVSMVVGGLIVHLPAMLIDRGSTPAAAAVMVGWLGYFIIIGRLSLGTLVDRLPPALVGGALLSLTGFGSLVLAQGSIPLLATALLGLSAGAEVDFLAFLISRRFGLKHYAQIYGCGISAFTGGAALGPYIAGHVHDATHSYVPALYIFAVATFAASGLLMSLHREVTPFHD